MNDEGIIQLFLLRLEKAIIEMDKKYRNYCSKIGNNILSNQQDTEECINDCYHSVWNAIPPNHPKNFPMYIGKIMRNLSLTLYRKNHAQKRNSGNFDLILDELDRCIPLYVYDTSWEFVNSKMLAETIENFLCTRKEIERIIFLKRYFLCMPINDIAEECAMPSVNIKVILHRVRSKLKIQLEKEGYFV